MEYVNGMYEKEKLIALSELALSARKNIESAVAELSKEVKNKTTVKKKPAVEPVKREYDKAGSEKKYQEGLLLYSQGKTTDACTTWEIALRLDPENIRAKKAYESARGNK